MSVVDGHTWWNIGLTPRHTNRIRLLGKARMEAELKGIVIMFCHGFVAHHLFQGCGQRCAFLNPWQRPRDFLRREKKSYWACPAIMQCPSLFPSIQ